MNDPEVAKQAPAGPDKCVFAHLLCYFSTLTLHPAAAAVTRVCADAVFRLV